LRIIKKLSFTFFTVVTASCLLAAALGYREQRVFNETISLPDKDQVIKYAKELIGTPYDPFMGKYDNVGADLGFIVCSDVPNIAYGQAGYSLKASLKEDFAKNPAAYDASNGNNPKNPYFHRRARNLYAYFKSIQELKPISYEPEVGDLVFYRKTERGYISHVALVSEATDKEYKIIESAPRTIVTQEVGMNSPIKRGWILAGFGRILE